MRVAVAVYSEASLTLMLEKVLVALAVLSSQVLAAFTLGQFSIGGLWMFCGCRRPRSISVSGVSVKLPRRRGGGILDGDRE